jgi:hypothetical protein
MVTFQSFFQIHALPGSEDLIVSETLYVCYLH